MAVLTDLQSTSRAAPLPARLEHSEPSLPLTLLELELSVAAFDGDEEDFGKTVRRAAMAAGGELLFELPASGLLADCRKIGVLRVPSEKDQTKRILLAALDADSRTIRIHEPDEATAGLVRLAEAFVDVLKRM